MEKQQKNSNILDQSIMNRLLADAKDMRQTFGEKDKMLKMYQDAYLMKWEEADIIRGRNKSAKIVMSPDARNEVLGSVRLVIATDPSFKIDPITDSVEGFDQDETEKSLHKWWEYSGRVQRKPIHYDMILSAILYGEMHTAVSAVSDIKKRLEKVDSNDMTAAQKKKRIDRLDAVGKITPVLLESLKPMGTAYTFDNIGLTRYTKVTSTTMGDAINKFGDFIPERLKSGSMSRTVDIQIYYDLDYYCLWVANEPCCMTENAYREIPIDVTVTEGSKLFDKPEEQSTPFLYTLIKSGLYNAQNLMMTVLYTAAFNLGISAQFVHQAPKEMPGKKPTMNFDEMVGFWETVEGESIQPLDFSKVLNNTFTEAFKLAEDKGQQSTIYQQAFGAPIGRNTTFSETSLLAQSGRLPLITTQRMGSEGISHIAELALKCLKDVGNEYRNNLYNFDPTKIPDNVIINTKLEIKLPQDQLQMATIARTLSKDGFTDKDWIRENILNIQNTKQMQENIWKEQATEMMFATWLQGMLQKMQNELNPPPPTTTTSGTGTDPNTMAAGAITPETEGMAGVPSVQAGALPGVGEGSAVSPDMQA